MDALGLPTDRPTWTAKALAEAAADASGPLRLVGARGAGIALAVRALWRHRERPLVVVTKDVDGARALRSDLALLLPEAGSRLLDVGEQSPWAEAAPDRRAAQQRLAALYALGRATPPPVTLVPAAALLRRVMAAADVRRRTATLTQGETVDRDALVRRLVDAGYLRVPMVEDPGTLSVRGSLLDVWAPGMTTPVRIELDFDEVTSVKRFDPTDQRSLDEVTSVALVPAREALIDDPDEVKGRLRDLCDAFDWPSSKTRSLIEDLVDGRAFLGAEGFLPAFVTLSPLLEQLPAAATIVVEEPSAIAEVIEEERAAAEAAARARDGQPHYPVEAFYLTPEEVDAWLGTRTTISLMSAPVLGGEHDALRALGQVDDDTPSLATYDQQELSRAVEAARKNEGQGAGFDPLLERLLAWGSVGHRVVFAARTSTQAERLATMLQHRGVEVKAHLDAPPEGWIDGPPDGSVQVLVGALSRGVVAPAEGLVLVTEEEIFGARTHRRKAKPPGKRRTQQLLEDLRSLELGDHVVHVDHGIGRYEGLIHRDVGGRTVDLLVVSYAAGDKLYLPVYRLNQIHKFRGDGGAPKLDRLGGQTFARTKSRAKKKVRDIADQLLKLYAERENAVGFAVGPIDDDYRAFEAAFPYDETDDQARAIEEVGVDLESPRPMDRLVCGDVGFGKTEVALRAAFRMVMAGRQVAVLCPTTVLAQQHARTFRQRLGQFPIEVAALSRFQGKKESDRVIRGLKGGSIDVVVGTHRLLSKDVHFKQLGLLVVDEEQRFGVAAKERIKALRTNVDVLTLSATPIPRTMQMAITGLRDLSVMTTPPVDRRAVRTVVTRNDPTVIREALERELSRGGQAFFVYNRIEGLAERARKLQELVPAARIAVAHGQMKERSLEKLMLDFVEGNFDVLCTTAIIENGLDIPRANTIIVDRADQLGLSQLYQLRGRVGRSKERGYCYLVLPPGGGITEEARIRLEALQRYSDLGAGFQLASLDLDLRGGGDLLGAEQSGTIAAVGVEMFCSMLEEASAELRGEDVEPDIDTELSFDVEALLPESYVPDVGVRLSLYKRLASAHDHEEVSALAEEMEDRFGRPPPEARRFIQLMDIKVDLRQLRVLACEASPRSVTLHLRDDTPLDPTAVTKLLATGKLPLKITPDMRLSRRSKPHEVFASGIAATQQLLRELQPALES